jgi:hypothetical protein
MIARETVYAALFALLTPLRADDAVDGPPDGSSSDGVAAKPGTPSPAQPFALVSRETIELQRVPPGLQPVLFMDEVLEDQITAGKGLYSENWNVLLHIGVTGAGGQSAAALLNPLIDAVLAAVRPVEGATVQNLGLAEVEEVKLDGAIVKNLSQNTKGAVRQAAAYIPLKILLPVT